MVKLLTMVVALVAATTGVVASVDNPNFHGINDGFNCKKGFNCFKAPTYSGFQEFNEKPEMANKAHSDKSKKGKRTVSKETQTARDAKVRMGMADGNKKRKK